MQGDSGPVLLAPSALCGTAESSALHTALLAVFRVEQSAADSVIYVNYNHNRPTSV